MIKGITILNHWWQQPGQRGCPPQVPLTSSDPNAPTRRLDPNAV
jgi:hypothetical protein